MGKSPGFSGRRHSPTAKAKIATSVRRTTDVKKTVAISQRLLSGQPPMDLPLPNQRKT